MSSNNTKVDFVLEDINTGEKFILDRNIDMYKCGRGKSNYVISQSILVSREHCMFFRTNRDLFVIDLESSNGVYINGVHQGTGLMTKLKINDIIGLGYPNTVPDDIPNSKLHSVYRLLLREEEETGQEVPNVDLTPEPGEVTTRSASDNKRRQSRDSFDCSLPRKVPKLEKESSTPDIIDISDESDDEIIVPKKIEKTLSVDEKIEGPKLASSTEVNASKTKDVSRSLQDENSEISLSTGASTCISSNGRKRSEDNDRNTNFSNIAGTSGSSSTKARKRSEDCDGNSKSSKAKKSNNSCNSFREESDKNHFQKAPKARRNDDLQSSASVDKTKSSKNTETKGQCVRKESTPVKKTSEKTPTKKLSSSKSSESNEHVAIKSKNGSSTKKTKNSSNLKDEETNGSLENDVDMDFFGPAFDIEELNLQERIDGHQSDEPKILQINNADVVEAIKYESELNIIDNDESVYKDLNDFASVVVPTPIKLKRVKQEPKTRYSEFDVVVVSDDEDGVFPASQLFGDEDDDEVEQKVKIKDEEIEECDREIFESRRNDDHTILLSDSDDEDNPWYNRLLRSQLLNESRLSGNDSTKEEVDGENFAHLDEDELMDVAERLEEEEPFKITKFVEEPTNDQERVEREELDENEEIIQQDKFHDAEEEEQDSEEENIFEANAEDLFKSIEKEIREVVFSQEEEKSKNDEKLKRKDKKRGDKSIGKEKASDETKDSVEKQRKGSLEKIGKKKSVEKTLENGETEAKQLPEDKGTSKKKRLSKEKKSLEEKQHEDKRLSEEKRIADKRLSEEKKIADKRLPEAKKIPVKRLPEEKKIAEKRLSVDRRLTEEKRLSVDKQSSTEKPCLPKQKSVEKTTEEEKTAAKNVKQKLKSKNDIEKKRFSDGKFLGISDEKADFAESKDTDNSSDLGTKSKSNPVVILTKFDNTTTRSLQIVEPPFLTNGEGRGVSCSVTKIAKSSDKLDTSVASTSGLNQEKESARKLTTKEKKELQLKSRIAEKMQLKEQKHRRYKNKWAAECLPPKKKPASPALTPQERKDIAMDRKERLKQLAIEKKMAEEQQPSTAKRINVKTKAKVTTNSRNDFLFKELVEEQEKQINANSAAIAPENENKNAEVTKENDKSLEMRMETSVNGESSTVNREKSPRKKNKSEDAGNKDLGKILQVNKDQSKENQEKGKLNLPNEILANDDNRQHLSENLAKPIPKISDKLPKQSLMKKSTMPYGFSHVFGEPSLKLDQIFTSNKNTEETSKITTDPRIKVGKTRKSMLKENREPNANKETGKTKTNKRVSFNDLSTKVDYFEIDPGNSLKKCVAKDAPLLVKKLPGCTTAETKACCPKLERFLLYIFKWNPVWLEEQKQFNTAPPVVDEKKLVPLLSKYSTYEDYYNVAEPLLALELWYGITRDYEGKVNQKACFHYSIVNHSVVLTTVPTTKLRVTTLMLEVVVSKRDAENQAHPVFGDLVIFEYISNRKSKEGCQRWKSFAYVTNVRQSVITPMTYFNRDLLSFAKDPHTLLTYTVMTKPLNQNDVLTNKVSRLRTISYLRSNIRMIQALQQLPVSSLCNTILHPIIEDYQLPSVSNLDSYPLVTKDKLNEKQLEAVAKVTEAAVQRLPKVCLIQGPPGTGKSKVIVNLVTQILYGNGRYQNNKKMRILVCAPSNAAIDEIVLRLLEIRRSFQKGNRFNMVRIGRNESMHPQVKEISVSELAVKDVKKTAATYMSPTFTSDSVEEEKRFLQARINSLELEKSNATTRNNSLQLKQIIRKLGDVQAKYDLLMNRRPADRLDTRELTRLQRAAENTLLKGADVITCTLTSCYTNQMEAIFSGKDAVSVCIVDEATQSSEAETLIPLMLGVKTLVLVGDTNQLPATVLSQKAKQFGLDQSLFARIQNAFDGQTNSPIILLDTQYRMCCSVAYWPNRYFYGGALKNGLTNSSYPVHGYKIMDLESTQNEDKFSNTEEASFVANVLYTIMTSSKLDLLNAPVRIGVITPYNNQKQMVIKKIRETIANVPDKMKKKIIHEVNTVDSFQGQERDIIIMSCVRSNGIGFLSDRQRLCVALTRAKHSLIICGNFATFKRDNMWKALLKDADERKAHVRIRSNAKIDEIKMHIVR